MRTRTRPKPFVKWAGGKQGLAEKLVTWFPKIGGRFFEPFIGGGSVLFALRPQQAVVGDLNGWLLDTYVAIREDWRRVATTLEALPNTKADYLRIRAVKPETLDIYQRAAHLIYLNKTCFRGLFRVNRRGQFNVPYGDYDRRFYSPANLEAVSDALRSVEIRPGDFELCLADVTEKDFVYLDPPYYKLGGYSDFNRYTPFQFKESDHIRLAAVCRELDERKIRWAVSNSDTPFIRRLFADFKMFIVSNRREINLNSYARDITELFISNYPGPLDMPLFQE